VSPGHQLPIPHGRRLGLGFVIPPWPRHPPNLGRWLGFQRTRAHTDPLCGRAPGSPPPLVQREKNPPIPLLLGPGHRRSLGPEGMPGPAVPSGTGPDTPRHPPVAHCPPDPTAHSHPPPPVPVSPSTAHGHNKPAYRHLGKPGGRGSWAPKQHGNRPLLYIHRPILDKNLHSEHKSGVFTPGGTLFTMGFVTLHTNP
jgi:hypothetical protein